MATILVIASSTLSKFSTMPIYYRLLLQRAAIFFGGLLLAFLAVAAPQAAKPAVSTDSASIPQIIITGKRMTPEQKRRSLEAEQRADKAAAAANAKIQTQR